MDLISVWEIELDGWIGIDLVFAWGSKNTWFTVWIEIKLVFASEHRN